MNRLFRDAEVETTLLRPVRRSVREVGRIGHVIEPPPVGIFQVFVLFLQVDVRDETARRVRFSLVLVTLFDLPLLFAVIPLALRLADDANVPAPDRLAEE